MLSGLRSLCTMERGCLLWTYLEESRKHTQKRAKKGKKKAFQLSAFLRDFPVIWSRLSTIFWSFHFLERIWGGERESGKDTLRTRGLRRWRSTPPPPSPAASGPAPRAESARTGPAMCPRYTRGKKPTRRNSQYISDSFVYFSIIFGLLSTIFWSFYFLQRKREREGVGKDDLELTCSTQ